MTNSKLGEVFIAAPCNVGWDNMQGTETVRFCHECKLNVYNTSQITSDEAEALLTSTAYAEGNVCLRLYRRKDGSLLTKDCPKGLRKVRAFSQRMNQIAAAGLTAFVATLPAFAQKCLNEFPMVKPVVTPGGTRVDNVQIVDGRPYIDVSKLNFPYPKTDKANYDAAQSFAEGQGEEKQGHLDIAISHYQIALTKIRSNPQHDPKFEEVISKALKQAEIIKTMRADDAPPLPGIGRYYMQIPEVIEAGKSLGIAEPSADAINKLKSANPFAWSWFREASFQEKRNDFDNALVSYKKSLDILNRTEHDKGLESIITDGIKKTQAMVNAYEALEQERQKNESGK